MPPNIALAAFVLGAVLLLVFIIGQGFEIFGIKVTGKVKSGMRLLSAILAVFFLGFAIILTGYEITQKVSTTDIVLTPTFTPQPEITGSLSGTKEDFGNPQFDGAVDHEVWGSVNLSENCLVVQKEGVLVVHGLSQPSDYSCDFTVIDEAGVEVKFSQLNTLAARMMISQYDERGSVQTVLRLFKGDDDAGCGLSFFKDGGAQINFNVSGYRKYTSAELGKWYEIKLTVDRESKSISCYVDNVLFATATPKNPGDWENARFFHRGFVTWFTGDGEVLLDDLLVISN